MPTNFLLNQAKQIFNIELFLLTGSIVIEGAEIGEIITVVLFTKANHDLSLLVVEVNVDITLGIIMNNLVP